MNNREMRKLMNLFEATSDDEAKRRERVQNAIEWLERNGQAMLDKGNRAAADPWFSRAGTLKGFLRRNLEDAENWIINGDNFLDAGWQDPLKQ